MRRPAHAAWVLLLAVALPGCQFSRTIVNPQFERLDTSAIQVGKTSWLEVLHILGPPTPPNSEAIGREGATLRFFRYPYSDQHTVGFTWPAGLVLPFRWSDEVLACDTVIEFDEAGIVKGVYQSGQDGIWVPLQGEGSREPQWVDRADTGS